MSDAGFRRFDSQLLGYGESDSQGAWCKFQIESDDLPVFRGRKKMTVELVLRFRDEAGNIIDPDTGRLLSINGEIVKPVEEEDTGYGKWWQKATQSGMFWSTEPDLFQALAGKDTDEAFREWVSSCPCAVSGGFDEAETSQGSQILKNDFAHILRAGAKPSGAKGEGSNKPVYSGIPLQHEYHALQHSKGWLGVAQIVKPSLSTEAEGVEWAMKIRSGLLAKWCAFKICELFEVDTRKKIDPVLFMGWCEKKGVKIPKQLENLV